ncbi:hypothetical protein Fcan01_13876 [Folsomia candida]|uniref:O-acyltransferase WSD1 C-terminal domain-containing protein n=1 Tax=Folsomia candida TaxID=158441 RepID=A0A226E3J7_FOLCA|nr:hypothetical protein Fcan01_13876 [Folsomia candida]
MKTPTTPSSKFSKSLKFILGAICWTFIIILFTIPLCILAISKVVVILLAKLVRKDLSSVTTGDAAFTIGCSWEKSKLSLGLLCHVQGHLKLEQVQDRFSSSLLAPKVGNCPKYEKLFSCLVTFCGYVFSKTLPPEAVDLNKLIYERKLHPGESLEQVVDDWMEKRYGELMPAWEVMVIPMSRSNNNNDEVKDGIEETIIAFKMHHAPYLVKEVNESIWKKILDAISTPVNLFMLEGPGTNPLKLTKPQTKWIYTFTTVDLAPMKAIRAKYDVHFASIMLSLIVGSIRQYLLEKEKELPANLSLVDTLPCQLHPSQNHILCNHWTIGIIKSPLAADNPLERVIETEKNFLRFHEAGLQKVAVNYLFPFAWLFPQFMAEKVLQKDRIGFNLGLTSLVGANKYEFLGQRIKMIYPLLTLIDSHPFTVFSWFTFSHSDKVDITLGAASDLFPCRNSLSKITEDYFHTEFRNLCLQCGIPLSS